MPLVTARDTALAPMPARFLEPNAEVLVLHVLSGNRVSDSALCQMMHVLHDGRPGLRGPSSEVLTFEHNRRSQKTLHPALCTARSCCICAHRACLVYKTCTPPQQYHAKLFPLIHPKLLCHIER